MSSSVDQVDISGHSEPALSDSADRHALVRRIAASRQFSRAHQLRDILLYLVDRAVTDPATAIHEQEIACTVLGRKADFNAHEDNIVRVQVSHLRKRLDDYFAAEGAGETLRISIPKGAYTLRFEERPTGQAMPERALTRDVQPEPAPSLPQRRTFNIVPIACIVIVLGATFAFVWWRYLTGRAPSSPVPIARVDDGDLLWPRFFGGQTTNIVVADTCLVMLQDILNTDIAVADYVAGGYPERLLDKVPDQNLARALRLISTRQYTSLADLNSARRLSELSHRYAPNAPAIRYARHMNVRDLKSGNFILLGSRRGIPWVRLFESQLNFSMEQDARTRRYYYRNKSPRAGEADAWYQETKPDATIETYADIALVPNLENTGYVLILSGIGMEASEAAGEFVASPEFQKALSGILPKTASRPQLRYFELLLRTRTLAGAAHGSQVVTSRILTSTAGS